MAAEENEYDLGGKARLSVSLTDAITEDYVDPTALELRVLRGDGTIDTYTYGGGTLLKDNTGRYHADISLSHAGTWTYRFIATGVNQGADWKRFRVLAAPI